MLSWSRFGGPGLVKGVKRCFQWSSVWHHGLCSDAICMTPPQCKVSATQGAHWWSERRCSNCHLLSSVDSVLYCYTNGPTHVPTVLSLASSAASVIASSLGPLWIVHCIVLLHRVAQSHSLSGHYCRSCVVVRFIHHALLHISSFDLINQTACCGQCSVSKAAGCRKEGAGLRW
jgi:hypothetical protein